MSDKTNELIERITDYLVTGGLFNPEMAKHDAVRDLLMECRDELSTRTPEQGKSVNVQVDDVINLQNAYLKQKEQLSDAEALIEKCEAAFRVQPYEHAKDCVSLHCNCHVVAHVRTRAEISEWRKQK